jgi:hypothetical protein
MKIINGVKSLFRHNMFVKPLSVITASTPPLVYLGVTDSLFMAEDININGQDLVAISADLAASFQGALILMVLLISVMYIYKPPKLVSAMLLIGGMALFASAMLETIGMVLVMYGLGLMFNSVVLDRFVKRNNLYMAKKSEKEIDALL